jgi:hypothetical protein
MAQRRELAVEGRHCTCDRSQMERSDYESVESTNESADFHGNLANIAQCR